MKRFGCNYTYLKNPEIYLLLDHIDKFLCAVLLSGMQCLLYNQTVDLQNQIEELKLDAQNSEKSLRVSLYVCINMLITVSNQ